MFWRTMRPAWGWAFWVLWAVIRTLLCALPVTGLEINRN